VKWPAVKAFMVKSLKLTFRSKADVFWIFAWPAIWLLMSAYVFIPPAAGQPMTLTMGVVNHDASAFPVNGSLMINILNRSEYQGVRLFDVQLYENESLMIEDIRKGKLDGGLVIPEKFGEKLIFGQTELKIYVGARDPQTAQITEYILRGFIENLNREFSIRKINETLRYMEIYASKYIPKNFTISTNGNLSWMDSMDEWMRGIAQPINASFIGIKPEALVTRSSILGWYTFGALGMSILYPGLIMGSAMAVEEKEEGTLRRILASPSTATDMLVGKTLAGLVILGLMSAFMMILGIYLCGAKIAWNPARIEHWIAAVMIPLIALMMMGLGMMLSLVSKSLKAASNLSVAIGLMLAFTAGIWFPKGWLPAWMQVIGAAFPGTWAIDVARSILVYGAGFSEVAVDAAKVAIATAVVYSLGVIAYKKVLRRYAEA